MIAARRNEPRVNARLRVALELYRAHPRHPRAVRALVVALDDYRAAGGAIPLREVRPWP